jgi:hypothetical protein
MASVANDRSHKTSPEYYNPPTQKQVTMVVMRCRDRHEGGNELEARLSSLIPWKGKIAVLFIGERKPYVTQAPPELVIRFFFGREFLFRIYHGTLIMYLHIVYSTSQVAQ